MKWGVAMVSLVVVLAGCAEPTMDGSSQEALEESTVRVKSSLNDSEKAAFEKALSELDSQRARKLFGTMDASSLSRLLDRRTAKEVIDLALIVGALDARMDQIRLELGQEWEKAAREATETARLVDEREAKARVAAILAKGDLLAAEGKRSEAMAEYAVARFMSPDNEEIATRIKSLGEEMAARRETAEKTIARVNSLSDEATRLFEEGKDLEAIDKLREMLPFVSDPEKREHYRKFTEEQLAKFQERQAKEREVVDYLDKVQILSAQATRKGDDALFVPRLKNGGDKALAGITLTIDFPDDDGAIVYEATLALLGPKDLRFPDLRPGEVWEMPGSALRIPDIPYRWKGAPIITKVSEIAFK